MGLKDEIEADFTDAMKNKEKEKMNTLRMLKSAIQTKEKEEGTELSDDDVQTILAKEAKNRQESIEQYEEGGREELAEKEKREKKLIESYLPDPLSADELETIVDDVVEEVGASDMSDMGAVMGEIMPKVRGRADGDEVNQMVRERLQ